MRTFGCNKPYMAKRVAHSTAEKSLFVSPSCIMACLSITTRKSTAQPATGFYRATINLSLTNYPSAYQPTTTPYDSETSGSARFDRNSAIKDHLSSGLFPYIILNRFLYLLRISFSALAIPKIIWYFPLVSSLFDCSDYTTTPKRQQSF